MRSIGSLLLTAALLLGTACSTDEAEVPPAGLAETYDLVIASDLVFVTSAETNDLRVIRPADTDYVRAPNPLEALSIPVVARPDKLARDVSYDAPDPDAEGALPKPETGVEVTGPYVYVRSASEPKISVVSTSLLREVATVDTGGAVTAFAARGPTVIDPGHSELYFTTQVQGRSTLTRVRIPANPAALTPEVIATLARADLPFVASTEATPEAVPAEGYGPVVALAVLPGNQLAMAARAFTGTPARPFATLRLQVEPTQAQATVVRRLRFTIPTTFDLVDPAARREVPVRALLTHGRITRNGVQIRAAGDRIFGLIDESACTDLARCGGVLAVQSDTGTLSMAHMDEVPEVKDANNNIVQPFLPAMDQPMLPLAFDGSVPTGFTLAPNAELRFAGAPTLPGQQPHVGVVAHASGQYFFFDAERLVHYDRDIGRPAARFDGLFTASGAVRPISPTISIPIAVSPREGYAEIENLSIIIEGAVTPRFFEIRPPNVLVVPPGVEVLPGDPVLFYATASGADLCLVNGEAPKVEVTAVTAVSDGTQLTLSGDGLATSGCQVTPKFFQVLAGISTAKPYVAYSGTSPLGRVGQGDANALKISAPPRFLAPGFEQGERLVITASSAPVPGTVRGDRYLFSVNPAFDPFNFSIANEVPRLERFFIPGPLVFSPGVFVEVEGVPEPELAGENRIYVAYPTADGVLQIALGLVNNGAREAVPVVPFQ